MTVTACMLERDGTDEVRVERVFPEIVDMAWLYFSGVWLLAVLILMVLAFAELTVGNTN